MLKSRIVPTALAVALLALAACSSTSSDQNAPLRFVPADTPFVIANADVIPDTTVASWTKQMQLLWPTVINMYEQMLSELPDGEDAGIDQGKRVVRAILDEIKLRDAPAKWEEIGLGPKSRGAFYGVGLVPVLRIELQNVEAFRSMIARIENQSGSQLGSAKIGDKDVWTIDLARVQTLLAIDGQHFVVSVLPIEADESLKRSVLGLDKPVKNLGESGTFASFEKSEGFLPYGSGWVDLRRIVALIDNDPGYVSFTKLFNEAPEKLEDVCRSELDALVSHSPRFVMGYTKLEPGKIAFTSRLDLDSALAQSVIKLATPPPGSGAKGGALYDMSLSLPVLKVKDFLIERNNMIVNAPFRCPSLASWNEKAIELKSQLSQFVPPPLSDFTGFRITLDRLNWTDQDAPDFSGKFLIASTNPMALVGLAQMAVPALQGFSIPTDGTAVTLPAGIVPNEVGFAPEMMAALNDKALAIGSGADSELSSYIAAPVAAESQLLRMAYSGAFYTTLSDLMDRFSALLPEKERANLDQQKALYSIYAQWLKHTDLRINATMKGIEMVQDLDLAQ